MAGWSGLEPNFLAFMINFNFLFVNYVDLATRYDLDFGHFSCEADQNPSWFNWVTPELEHVT